MMATVEEFEQIDMRVGRVVHVEDFPRAKKPSYRVQIDFGPEVGTKWSSVAAKREYTPQEMLGRLVVGVINFPPRNIAGFNSEVLLLGVPTEEGSLSLLQPSRPAAIGGRVY